MIYSLKLSKLEIFKTIYRTKEINQLGDKMFHHTYLGTLAVTYKNAVNIHLINLFYNENNRSVIF